MNGEERQEEVEDEEKENDEEEEERAETFPLIGGRCLIFLFRLFNPLFEI